MIRESQPQKAIVILNNTLTPTHSSSYPYAPNNAHSLPLPLRHPDLQVLLGPEGVQVVCSIGHAPLVVEGVSVRVLYP